MIQQTWGIRLKEIPAIVEVYPVVHVGQGSLSPGNIWMVESLNFTKAYSLRCMTHTTGSYDFNAPASRYNPNISGGRVRSRAKKPLLRSNRTGWCQDIDLPESCTLQCPIPIRPICWLSHAKPYPDASLKPPRLEELSVPNSGAKTEPSPRPCHRGRHRYTVQRVQCVHIICTIYIIIYTCLYVLIHII